MQQHASTYSVHTHPRPLGWGQMSFFESSHVAYQSRSEWSIEHRASTYFILKHTLNLWIGLKGKQIYECGHLAYQIKGKEV